MSMIYPREILKKILEHKAAAIIMAHNHPSGDPTPSPEDYLITKQIMIICNTICVTLHEHIIIGNTGCYSMADQGNIYKFSIETASLLQAK